MAARACNDAGIALIKQFEGAGGWDATAQVFRPYADPIEIWTIGWGHEITVSHEALRGQACGAQADQLYPGGLCVADATSLLQDDVSATCAEVQGLLKVTVNDNQFAALVSFTYNLGVENLAASTLLQAVEPGRRGRRGAAIQAVGPRRWCGVAGAGQAPPGGGKFVSFAGGMTFAIERWRRRSGTAPLMQIPTQTQN